MFVVFEALDDVDKPKLVQQGSLAVRLAKLLSRFDNTTRKNDFGELLEVAVR